MANNPTAFKQYAISEITSADISLFTFPTDGGNVFKAFKVGKLYFGIYLDSSPDNGISSTGAATIASATRLASLVGKTVDTVYTSGVILSAGNIVAWNGASWASSGFSSDTLEGFLVV